jgi:hypothetical protein
LETGPGKLLEGFAYTADHVSHPIDPNAAGVTYAWAQPLYDYSGKNGPIPTTYKRVTTYTFTGTTWAPFAGSGVPWLIGSGAKLAAAGVKELSGLVICPGCFTAVTVVSAAGFLNNSFQKHYALSVDYVDHQTYIGPPSSGPFYTPAVPKRLRK